MMLDYFAEFLSLSFKPSKEDYYFVEGNLADFTFVFVKPSTYVNNSGVAALQILNKYNPDLNDFLVLYDDVDLPLSTLRIRLSGGAGGHNGISSVIYHLNSDQFPRIRIGVGNNIKPDKIAKYVLEDFKKDEIKILKEAFKNGKILLEEYITGGITKMLNANSRFSKPNTNNQAL